ncbi:hypothetical protein UPYG_G00249930 [Umbra pygmaea]|uniref:Nuclear protein MDM1 n=1 Tax=Umbra pygmaea TaxID=75934 RepID=A0ABD0WNZ3_UMBPY
MPVHFKGSSEYKNKFKGQAARSQSASPLRRMQLAGLRSDHLGICREPQFLSKKRVPSFHTPQVSRSLQWNPTTTGPSQRQVDSPRPSSPEREQTPLAPRALPDGPPKDPQQSPTTLQHDPAVYQGQTYTRSPLATVERQEQSFDGAQYVLRRKAGLKLSEKRRGLQKSEYDKQFQWKTPVSAHASPLLAAEQMLYTSHRSIPPFKANSVVLETEYSRNFKAAQPPRGPRLRRDVETPLRENVPPEKVSKQSRRKKQREQKARTSIVVQEIIPVAQLQHQQRDKGMLQQEVKSRNKAPRPHRKIKSEYNSNFRPPLNYAFKDGTWVKATSAGQEGYDEQLSHFWYREVQALREKAEAYKRRAWGTHFSRLHLNQILSDQNQLWEASTPSSNLSPGDAEDDSISSPTIQALDLARGNSVEGSSSSRPGHPASISPVSSRRSSLGGAGNRAGLLENHDPEASTVPIQRRLAWEQKGAACGPQVQDEDMHAEKSKEDEENKAYTQERQNGLIVPRYRRASSAESYQSSRGGGRMPTPTLHRIATLQRTHHDLTTPATGGAILVSPPKIKEANGWVRRSEAPLGKPSSPIKRLWQASPKQAPTQNQLKSPPAAGVSTLDTHPLREDSWSGDSSPENRPDRPLQAKMLRVPTKNGRPFMAGPPPVNRIQGMLRDAEFQHNGNLGLRMSDLLLCPNGGCGTDDEDDRMSQISSKSAASCSTASQVLDRAQRRKEDFWGKGEHPQLAKHG